MTSTSQERSTARRGRSGRRPLVVLLVLVVALGLAGWGGHAVGFRLNRTTQSVPVPDASASPEQVVTAYVAAYNARDFDTMRAVYPSSSLPRFEVLGRMENLRIVESQALADPENGLPVTPGHSYHRVGVRLDLTDLDGSNLAYDEGPNGWTYLLERDSSAGPWQITDHGNG